ncbi:MAG: RHS repeat-associated core domain-containing protein [Armatimonadia bacterium]
MVGCEDADGKRVTKEDAAGFTRFIYQGPDMLALLQERDEAGNVVAHYTMGEGLEAMRRSEESRFYHYDWLGSTFELTDAAAAVTDEYLYDAWGNALAASGATLNPHRYVGRERYYTESESSLQQLALRSYRASSASFLSTDPLPIRSARSSYAYASGSPARFIDPSGAQSVSPDGLSTIIFLLSLLGAEEYYRRKVISAFNETDRIMSDSRSIDQDKAKALRAFWDKLARLARPYFPTAIRQLDLWMNARLRAGAVEPIPWSVLEGAPPVQRFEAATEERIRRTYAGRRCSERWQDGPRHSDLIGETTREMLPFGLDAYGTFFRFHVHAKASGFNPKRPTAGLRIPPGLGRTYTIKYWVSDKYDMHGEEGWKVRAIWVDIPDKWGTEWQRLFPAAPGHSHAFRQHSEVVRDVWTYCVE